MARAVLTGIYTLTPTHCGTGQTSGAVDLPIARDAHTRLPVLPASGLKGAARSMLNEAKADERALARHLFGLELEGQGADEEAKAGSLVLLEGRLLLYPLRSLQRPFLYATCPLILERFERDVRALGLREHALCKDWVLPRSASQRQVPGELPRPRTFVTDPALAGQTLVVEDLVYKADEVGVLTRTEALTRVLQELLPNDEQATRQRIAESLVVLPDNDFMDVLQRAVPVQARIKLDDETKTTGNGGNLWYEEALPPDCLFAVAVTQRAGYRENGVEPAAELAALLRRVREERHAIQIGGNETVGQGFCWWTATPGLVAAQDGARHG